MRICLYIFFCTLNFSANYAQNAVSIMMKADSLFRNTMSFSLQMKVEYFGSEQGGIASYSDTLLFKKKGTRYYHSYNGETTLVNDKYSVFINDKNQTIIVVRNKEDKNNGSTVFPISLVESRLKLIERSNGNFLIELDAEGLYPGLKKVVYKIADSSSLINEMEYQYKSAEGILFERILYKTILFNCTDIPVDMDFSEKRFISVSKGSYKGVGLRSDYKIIVQQ